MSAKDYACCLGVVADVYPLYPGRQAGRASRREITTDTSIDCSSVRTIARDLYAKCKTDQAKHATWYFVRRWIFHCLTSPRGTQST